MCIVLCSKDDTRKSEAPVGLFMRRGYVMHLLNNFFLPNSCCILNGIDLVLYVYEYELKVFWDIYNWL